jgi:hypothetical protein
MSIEDSDNYSVRNFENLVIYYGKEIKQINQGVSVSKILSISERGTLLRSGVLLKSGSGTRIQWRVSKRALDFLLKMEKVRVNKNPSKKDYTKLE